MHLLAILLQYLLGRFSNKPQTQPVPVRSRRPEASSHGRQVLESSAEFDFGRAMIYQAMRSEKRNSDAASRAGPSPSGGSDPTAGDAVPEVDSSSPASAAGLSPPLRA